MKEQLKQDNLAKAQRIWWFEKRQKFFEETVQLQPQKILPGTWQK